VSQHLTDVVPISDIIWLPRYDDPSASSVMAHRQHKKTKSEAASVMQNDPTNTSVQGALDVDSTTYGNLLDSDSSGKLTIDP